MMRLIKRENPEAKLHTLEEVLDELCKYGSPRVSKMDDGWHARVDMHVTSVGASFEVKAEFDHKTALEASTTCLRRVTKCLNDLSS